MLLCRDYIYTEICGGYSRKSSKLFYNSAPKVEQYYLQYFIVLVFDVWASKYFSPWQLLLFPCGNIIFSPLNAGKMPNSYSSSEDNLDLRKVSISYFTKLILSRDPLSLSFSWLNPDAGAAVIWARREQICWPWSRWRRHHQELNTSQKHGRF